MTLTFDYDGRTLVNWTVADALEAGVPQAIIDAALTDQRLAAIKAETRRRIYAVASSEAQMNMAAATAVISGKAASARSDAEKATLVGAEAAIGWVAAMRLTIATLAADPDADFTADAAWPDVPDEAQDMIANF